MGQKTVDESKFLVKSVGIGFELIIFTGQEQFFCSVGNIWKILCLVDS